MGYFPVRYDSRVVIYEHKMFIRLATGPGLAAMAGRQHKSAAAAAVVVGMAFNASLTYVRKLLLHNKKILIVPFAAFR